jgi:hypothetical protein
MIIRKKSVANGAIGALGAIVWMVGKKELKSVLVKPTLLPLMVVAIAIVNPIIFVPPMARKRLINNLVVYGAIGKNMVTVQPNAEGEKKLVRENVSVEIVIIIAIINQVLKAKVVLEEKDPRLVMVHLRNPFLVMNNLVVSGRVGLNGANATLNVVAFVTELVNVSVMDMMKDTQRQTTMAEAMVMVKLPLIIIMIIMIVMTI